MKIIAGLGNPGAEYDRTRHNVGFMALDAYAHTAGVAFTPARLGEVAMASYRGRQLRLLKPSTFMNLSGKAVRYWMQQENVPPERTLVLVDDLALPLGTVRLRAKGSAGGHNGLKDIEAQLQTAAYPRLRIGIGHEFTRGRQIDFVLHPFSPEEFARLEPALALAVQTIQLFCTQDIARVMNLVNTQPAQGAQQDHEDR